MVSLHGPDRSVTGDGQQHTRHHRAETLIVTGPFVFNRSFIYSIFNITVWMPMLLNANKGHDFIESIYQ